MLKPAEQGCNGAYWPVLSFADKFVCSSLDFLLQTLGAHADKPKLNL
jgi:hypothetical protein